MGVPRQELVRCIVPERGSLGMAVSSRGGTGGALMGVLADTLRQARAQKGVSLKEAEQATRINRHYLSALEDENFAVLPALIYQRGIVRSYAAYLDLDPGKLLAMFEEARGGESTADLVAAVKPLEMPHHWAPNFAIITFMVVMSAIVFAWVYSLSFNAPDAAATMPPAVPTVTPIPSNLLALAPQSPVAVSTGSTPDAGSVRASSDQPGVRRTGEQALAAGTANRPLQPPAVPTTVPAPTGLPTATTASQSLAQQVAMSPTPTTVSSPTPQPSPTPSPTVATAEPTAPPQSPAGSATIRVIAQGDINVTVVGDGVTLYSGWLGSGTTTAWFTAADFEVYTSDGSLTLFENIQTGQQFFMGYGPNETYYLGG